MQVTYDTFTDALSVVFSSERVAGSRRLDDDTIVDFSEAGDVVAIESLSPSTFNVGTVAEQLGVELPAEELQKQIQEALPVPTSRTAVSRRAVAVTVGSVESLTAVS